MVAAVLAPELLLSRIERPASRSNAPAIVADLEKLAEFGPLPLVVRVGWAVLMELESQNRLEPIRGRLNLVADPTLDAFS